MEIEGHRVDDENTVLAAPWLRRGAEDEIFEGLVAESDEAGVDACGIGVELRAFGGRELGEDALGEIAETVQPRRAVAGDGGFAEEFGEFAGGAAAEQIHLKKSFLRMEPPEGARDVGAGLAAQGGHALRITLDGHGRAQASDRHGAIETGQARAEAEIEPACREGPDQQQDADGAGEEAEAFRDGGGHGASGLGRRGDGCTRGIHGSHARRETGSRPSSKSR